MEEKLLIIIGRIYEKSKDNFTVRILFDIEEANKNIYIKLNDDKKVLFIKDKSLVIEFDNLKKNKIYNGTAIYECTEFNFNFSTKQNPKIAYVSCCGYLTAYINGKKDNDKDTLEKLYKSDYDIMIHMGDQLYLDVIEFKNNLSYHYRKFYRRVFGSTVMQKILRKGSHIMICDDHEFTDKVSYLDVKKKYCNEAKNFYMEYQERLWSDNYTCCKNFSYLNQNVIIPNIRYEMIFNYDKKNPFISENLQNEIIDNLKKNQTNIIVMSLALIGNNKIGSYVKHKIGKSNFDDSTLNLNIKNTISYLNKIKEKKNKGYKFIFISGDLHLSCKSYIKYKNDIIGRQYISSGLTKSVTINKNNIDYICLLLYDKFNFGSYKINNFKIKPYKRNYDTNFLILDENLNDNIYIGNNFPIKNLYSKYFFLINLLIISVINYIFKNIKF